MSLQKIPPVSASAAEDTTCIRVLDSICMGSLKVSVFVLMKKYPTILEALNHPQLLRYVNRMVRILSAPLTG